MSYFYERAKRKGIARAVTNQCCIVGEVGYNDITIVDQTLGMDTIDVEFTINGKDGDVFCAKLDSAMFCGFGTRYDVVGMVSLKEPEKPKHNHEAFIIVDCGNCAFTAKPLRVYNTTMTRKEWLNSLFESGNIHGTIKWPMGVSHDPLHFGVIKYRRGEPRTEYRYGGRPVYNTLEDAVAECAKLSAIAIRIKFNDDFYSSAIDRPKIEMYDIWGIAPITKVPVMIIKSVAAPSFKVATNMLHIMPGYGTTMVHGEIHYNNRPVFPTETAAKRWLAINGLVNAAISAGDLMRHNCGDVPRRIKRTFDIWGIDVDRTPIKVGTEIGMDFNHAVSRLWRKRPYVDGAGRSYTDKHNCKYTYLGHPVFESESEAQAYIYTEANPKPRKVTELPCFKSVSDVIGKQSAMCELFKVMNTPECHLDLDNPNIVYAFNWNKTPQGNDYWYGVSVLIQTNMEEARKHIYVDLNGERDFVMPGCFVGFDLADSPDKSAYFTISVSKDRK